MLLTRLLENDFYRLSVFLAPLAFAEIAVDVGEQVLNHSIAKGEDVVEVLAGFGLAYVFVKFFVGVLGEAKQASLVLVHDRRTFFKIFIYLLVCGVFVFVLLLVTAVTQLGVWLIKDLHGVSADVTEQARLALALLAFYPIIDLISWYHAGLLMQYHYSTVVGIASLADITAQIVSVAVLVFTPLLCNNTIAIPITAAYCGVIVRCIINMSACYKKIFRLLSSKTTSPVSVWRLTTFLLPLMLALAVQRASRPVVNLLVARSATSQCAADTAVAVLTACYPVGHLPYGWLNQLRAITPAFQSMPKGEKEMARKPVKGWKIAVFSVSVLGLSATVSFVLFWVPGISEKIMKNVVGVSEYLALLCVNPLRIFSLFCFTVSTRASLTGWLTLHRQTKLLVPSTVARLGAILAALFSLPQVSIVGAMMGVLALFSGFLTEAVLVFIATVCFVLWKRCRSRCKTVVFRSKDQSSNEDDMIPLSGLLNSDEQKDEKASEEEEEKEEEKGEEKEEQVHQEEITTTNDNTTGDMNGKDMHEHTEI